MCNGCCLGGSQGVCDTVQFWAACLRMQFHFDWTLGGLEAPPEWDLPVMIDIFIGVSTKKMSKGKKKCRRCHLEKKVEAAPCALVPTAAALWRNWWGVQGWPIHADWHFYWISDISCCCTATWKAGQWFTFFPAVSLPIESKHSV